MMSRQDLNQCAQADINACDPKDLVDLKDVTIDASLPVPERIDRFLAQVRNPYLFKVDGLVVKVNYGGSKNLSSSLSSLMIPQ